MLNYCKTTKIVITLPCSNKRKCTVGILITLATVVYITLRKSTPVCFSTFSIDLLLSLL